jgi:NADH-quinone oxidoreductase subunit E
MLREQRSEQVESVVARYPERRSAILPLLEMAQELEGGHVSAEAMEEIAEILGLTPGYVYSVASFYTMLHLEPVGNRRFYVCQTLSCALAGADELVRAIEQRLGISVGETTPDGRHSLFTMECLGSCGTAPVVMVGRDYHEGVTLERLEALLAEPVEGKPMPAPVARGPHAHGGNGHARGPRAAQDAGLTAAMPGAAREQPPPLEQAPASPPAQAAPAAAAEPPPAPAARSAAAGADEPAPTKGAPVAVAAEAERAKDVAAEAERAKDAAAEAERAEGAAAKAEPAEGVAPAEPARSAAPAEPEPAEEVAPAEAAGSAAAAEPEPAEGAAPAEAEPASGTGAVVAGERHEADEATEASADGASEPAAPGGGAPLARPGAAGSKKGSKPASRAKTKKRGKGRK